MSKAAIWAFAATTAVLAIADWNLTTLPAGDEKPILNAIQAGGVSITAEKREVDVEGRKEAHLFLVMSGTGKGTVTATLQESSRNPLSRVATMPTISWTRKIDFDQKGNTTEVDLGAIEGTPQAEAAGAPAPRGSRQLVATADEKTYVMLWGEVLTVEYLAKDADGAPNAHD